MRVKFFYPLFALTIICLFLCNNLCYGQQKVGNVVIVNSYSHDNEVGHYLDKSIRKAVKSILPECKMSSFYINADVTKNISLLQSKLLAILSSVPNNNSVYIFIGSEVWMVYKTLNEVEKKNIIICTANDFITSDYSSYLSTGMVPQQLRLNIDSSTVGFNAVYLPIRNSVKDNLDFINKLLPSVHSYFYLSEQTFTDYVNIEKIQNTIGDNNLSVINMRKVIGDKISSTFRSLYRPNAVILVNNYHLYPLISSMHATVEMPVFFMNAGSDKDFVLGGMYENVKTYSMHVANTVKSFYDGKSIEQIRAFPYPVPVMDVVLSRVIADKFSVEYDKVKPTHNSDKNENEIGKYFIKSLYLIALLALFALLVFVFIIVVKRRRALSKTLNKYEKLSNSYNAIYNSSPVGIALFDKSGTLVENNAEYEKLVKPIIIGDIPIRKIPLSDIPILDKEVKNEVINGTNVVKNCIFGDDDSLQLNYRVALLSLEQHVLLIIWDNTQVYLNHRDKEKMYDFFKDGISISGLNVAELNLSTNEIFADKGWYAKLNTDSKTSLPDCFIALSTADRNLILHKLADIKNNIIDSFTKELMIIEPDGEELWLNFVITGRKINDFNECTVVCVLEEISAKKIHDRKLLEHTNRLIAINKFKYSYIASMGHSVRSYLNAIVGFSELITESGSVNEKRELLGYIQENNDALLLLISDIVNMVNIKTGNVECTLNDFDFNHLMDEIVEDDKEFYSFKRCKVQWHCNENPIVFSDKDLMKTALERLIRYAVYLNNNYNIDVQMYIRPQSYEIKIPYIGTALTEQELHNAKDSFSIPESGIENKAIILQIASSSIDILKGTLTVQKIGENESCFVISIPLKSTNIDSQIGIKEKIEKASQIPDFNENLKTILIAEDNDNNFQLLMFILKKKYNILHAINGKEAVDIFINKRPDLILMDIKMPVMDGYEATEEIRKVSAAVPIIAVTAYSFDRDKEKVMEHKFSGYISKPVSESDLISTINNFLN